MLNEPLEGVRELLQSPEVKHLEEEIARHVGLRIVPADYGILLLHKRELDLAEVSLATARELLVREHDALLRFEILIQDSERDDPDGEFPPGEEPGAEDRAEPVMEAQGLVNGAAVTALCFYVLAQGPKEKLLRFLELQRYPYWIQFARELRSCFKRASGRTSA